MSKQIKALTWNVKILDENNRIIEMVGSTEDEDRAGDRMVMRGANLTNYNKNPVILANHSYGNGEKPTVIGRALNVNIIGSTMVFKIQFAETENGKDWFYLYANKYMNASSIGFIPIKAKPNEYGGYDFLEWELLELSMVAVPCNPNAVQRAFEDGKISKALFNTIKNYEEDVENMKKEEIETLISKGIDAKVKELNDAIKSKDDKIKELEGELKVAKELEIEKSGAALSKATKEAITMACSGINEHIKALSSLVKTETEEPDGDEGEEESKDYTEEEIQKMIENNVKNLIEGEN